MREAEVSARSLKRFTKYPVCIITDTEGYINPLFDFIMHETMPGDFAAKIIGVAKTPFERTVFLDSDTFICSSIDGLFEVLDLFDMCMVPDNFIHGYSFFHKYNPDYKLQYEKVIPEFNTGVMVYEKNTQVLKLFSDWEKLHEEMNIKADMPSFREAFIKNTSSVSICPLPFEYNYHGTKSFGMAYNEIKIIHERLGEKWNTLTTVMLPFEKMERKARMMNKYHYKRIIVSYFGVIPYTFSPYRLKYKIKEMLGIKKTKKSETF